MPVGGANWGAGAGVADIRDDGIGADEAGAAIGPGNIADDDIDPGNIADDDIDPGNSGAAGIGVARIGPAGGGSVLLGKVGGSGGGGAGTETSARSAADIGCGRSADEGGRWTGPEGGAGGSVWPDCEGRAAATTGAGAGAGAGA